MYNSKHNRCKFGRKIVNEHFKNRTQINLVLYGKNNNDNNVMKKYLKLQELIFKYIYLPGWFI